MFNFRNSIKFYKNLRGLFRTLFLSLSSLFHFCASLEFQKVHCQGYYTSKTRSIIDPIFVYFFKNNRAVPEGTVSKIPSLVVAHIKLKGPRFWSLFDLNLTTR